MALTAAVQTRGVTSARPQLPARRVQRAAVVVRASSASPEKDAAIKSVAVASIASAAFLTAGNAQAATELMSLAAGGDNRFSIIATLAVPVLGWVAFNIAQPALNQLDAMSEKKGRAVAAGLGLGAASLLAAQNAEAAQSVADLAASDNRLGLIATLALPVLGWVAFNIFQPALNQLDAMSEKNTSSKPKTKSKRGVVAGLGLGAASMLAAQNADAAQLVNDLAAGSDNRFSIIATLAVPVLGWVAFNIAQPALNQLDAMSEKKGRAVAAGLGLGAASLLAAQNAEAAQSVADLAASDNRFGLIATLAVPVLGWVLFNILGPLQNQLDSMKRD